MNSALGSNEQCLLGWCLEHAMADTLSLTILPHILTIASFPKSQLPACTHGLLYNLLYNEEYTIIFLPKLVPIPFFLPSSSSLLIPRDEQFFSYTESSDLCTMILSKDALSTFPKDLFEFSPHLYRAVEITGSLGAGTNSRLSLCIHSSHHLLLRSRFISSLPCLFCHPSRSS